MDADKERKDTIAKEKEWAVLQLVIAAMRKQDAATFHGASSEGMDIVAQQTTDAIVKLFI